MPLVKLGHFTEIVLYCSWLSFILLLKERWDGAQELRNHLSISSPVKQTTEISHTEEISGN